VIRRQDTARRACRVALVRGLTDDAAVQRRIDEVVTSICE
jgi:hypothetical protein